MATTTDGSADVVVMARCWQCEAAEPVHGDEEQREALLERFLRAHPRATHLPQIAYTQRVRLAS